MSSAVRAVTVKKTKSYIPETDVTLDNGSIVHWSERIGHKVPVTCGGLCCNHVKRLVRIYKLEDREKFTGLCNKCRATKYFDDITNPITKSQFLITKKTEKGTPVICGRCPDDRPPRILLDPDPKSTGYCTDHCHDHRKHIDEKPHRSGALVLLKERDPATRFKVAFLCANRDKKEFPDCLNKDITWTVDVRRAGWRGLCETCKKQSYDPRKLIHDEEFSMGMITHIIHWSEEDKDKRLVPITCGWCGTKEVLSRTSVLDIRRLKLHNPKDWRCRVCYDNPSLLEEKMRKQIEHENGNDKKQPGPKKGEYAFITWENMKDAFKKVEGFPTKPKAAKALGVSVSGIDKWMQREGIDWQQVQQRFINTY
jgi:hypothetical protein